MTTAPRSAVVIGGGIVGLATAYDLSRHGISVTVVDEGHIDQRASSATAGIIGGSSVIPWANDQLWGRVPGMLLDRTKPLYLTWPLPKKLASFLRYSLQSGRPDTVKASAAGLANLGLKGRAYWADLLRDLPEAAELFDYEGCLLFYDSEAAKKGDAKDTALRRGFGMQIDDLTADEVRQILPPLEKPVFGASSVTTAGHVVDPVGLQNALCDGIKRNGGQFAKARAEALKLANGAVISVKAGTQEISGDVFVLAAGQGAADLGRELGIRIPMAPAWGVSVTFQDPGINLKVPLLVLNEGLAITPSRQGLRVSGLLQIGGEGKASTMQARLMTVAKQIFGDFSYTGTQTFMGPRPLTADSLPFLGQDTSCTNLFHNFGHGHWGLTQASTSASVVRNLILGRPSEIDISAYRPDRFCNQ